MWMQSLYTPRLLVKRMDESHPATVFREVNHRSFKKQLLERQLSNRHGESQAVFIFGHVFLTYSEITIANQYRLILSERGRSW